MSMLTEKINSMSFPLVTIPTTALGYNYDIQISHWNDGLTGYQRYANGTLVPLEGGLGSALILLKKALKKSSGSHQYLSCFLLIAVYFQSISFRCFGLPQIAHMQKTF